jgi:hypothetical protein
MDAGELAARERLETLFRAFDRLTPDELARIGFRRAPDEERDGLRHAVDDAARRTGRVGLVEEARAAARDAVIKRYSAGSFHPTFVGLNWGLSQGRVEDRVAIAGTLADAAAAAVVEDALNPEIATELALDAAAITSLAAGEAWEGSLAQALRATEDPELRASPQIREARRVAVLATVAIAVVAASSGVIAAAAAGVVAGIRAVASGGTRRGG